MFLLWYIEFLPLVHRDKPQKKFEDICHIFDFCKALDSVFQVLNITENILAVCINIIEIGFKCHRKSVASINCQKVPNNIRVQIRYQIVFLITSMICLISYKFWVDCLENCFMCLMRVFTRNPSVIP